jgi:hypothetical protein
MGNELQENIYMKIHMTFTFFNKRARGPLFDNQSLSYIRKEALHLYKGHISLHIPTNCATGVKIWYKQVNFLTLQSKTNISK